jgi:flavodoxin
MKTLVPYYSLSGTTRTVATQLAGDLGADIEEIRCKRYLPGFWGYLRAAYDSARGNLPPTGLLAGC